MKTLVVYYSRTGITKQVAESLGKRLKADIEVVMDNVNRKGVIGYIKSGYEAMSEKVIKIAMNEHDPSKYGLVVIGTPVWGHKVSSPIRAYLLKNKIKIKKVAFFCTMGGSGADATFRSMSKVLYKKPVTTLALKMVDVQKIKCNKKIKEFVDKIV